MNNLHQHAITHHSENMESSQRQDQPQGQTILQQAGARLLASRSLFRLNIDGVREEFEAAVRSHEAAIMANQAKLGTMKLFLEQLRHIEEALETACNVLGEYRESFADASGV